MTPPTRAGVVSTIIPVHNRAGLLTEAVASVLAQTYRPIEVVIVDDGSTDETAAVAQALAARHPDEIIYLRQDRAREWRARNRGLQVATGEFIQFLDSDDLIAPEKLASQVHALRAHPECGISYCYVREYALGDPLPQRPARRTGETFAQLLPALLAGRIWPYPSPLFRRSVIDAAGYFLELSAYPDWELECRMAVTGVRLHHCRSFLAETRNTHRIEGRRKSGKPPDALRDLARVLELIVGHARRAQVPDAAMAVLTGRLFAAGRQCASIGLDDEARRLLDLASGVATGWRRRGLAGYVACSRLIGWHAVGHVSESAARARWLVWRSVSVTAGRWRHRLSVGMTEVVGLPLTAWPRHLATLWRTRPSRRRPAQP